MNVSVRQFSVEDIPFKVRWVNDPANNRYLHYSLPLKEDDTLRWYERVRNQNDRLDMTILVDDKPVGIAGLLNVDYKNFSAEMYILIGDVSYKGLGVAGKAMEKLLRIGYGQMCLRRIYLYTETENKAAVRAYEKFGFVLEGTLRDELISSQGRIVSRFLYSLLRNEFEDRYGTI